MTSEAPPPQPASPSSPIAPASSPPPPRSPSPPPPPIPPTHRSPPPSDSPPLSPTRSDSPSSSPPTSSSSSIPLSVPPSIPPSECATYASFKYVAGRVPLPSLPSKVGNVCHKLSELGIRAENTVTNVWANLKVGQSMTESARGKVKLKARSITEGGYETMYKHNFTTLINEKLLKTFACYLSTSDGPVAGTLYLSDIHVAFCSDRPLQSVQPNGVESWLYYKVQIALNKLVAVNPVTVQNKKQTEKSIALSTIDGQDFWLRGFVNHEKASKHLLKSMEASLKSDRLIQ